jgi:LmbE family N-acetylglucosaminyl deacetylase
MSRGNFSKKEPMKLRNAAVIVAHPDDETLWAGGTILQMTQHKWTIMGLCRASDTNRSLRFYTALVSLKGTGYLSDMDDGPEQTPIPNEKVQKEIMSFLPAKNYDLIITHGPDGEYTSHRRHEEVCLAVVSLWMQQKIVSNELWMFAYEDNKRKHLPAPVSNAHKSITLPVELWKRKYEIITQIYGFKKQSFEARTTPKTEAFWCFDSPENLKKWLAGKKRQHENTPAL